MDVAAAEFVGGERVRHAPEDRVAVGAGGQLREMLADVNTGHVGGHRLELAAVFGRGVGLKVEAVEVGRAAAKVDEDRRLRRCRQVGFLRPGQVVGKGYRRAAESPDTEHVSSSHAVTGSMYRHGVPSFQAEKISRIDRAPTGRGPVSG